jgi:hypothetical protein
MRPVGSGRFMVRFMRPSLNFSYTWFSALADEDAIMVPRVVQPMPAQSMDSLLPAA